MIQIEKAEAGQWYRTPRGFRIRLIGPDEKTPGAFSVETESGRRYNMEAGSELRADEDAPAAPADNDLLSKIAGAVKGKDHVALQAALVDLPDGELTTVLSRHPVLWVVGAVNAEKRRRSGGSDPSSAFDEAPRQVDRPITCPTCGEQASARLNRSSKWIVVTHAGLDAPVCPGAGHVVIVPTGETPEPAASAADRLVQVRDLDTLDAVAAFRAELEGKNALTKTIAAELSQQGRFLESGSEIVDRAKAGAEEAIRSLASWGWVGANALDVRPGVRRAFASEATWAEGEAQRIADEREASIARDVAGTLRAEAITGPDPERVDRALDAEEPDPALRARVDALLIGVRGCRDAARIELDPAVVERALAEEQVGQKRPTVLGILESRAAALRGETRRNVRAKRSAADEVADGLAAEDAAADRVLADGAAVAALQGQVALLSDEEAIEVCRSVVADPNAPREAKDEARVIARLRMELMDAARVALDGRQGAPEALGGVETRTEAPDALQGPAGAVPDPVTGTLGVVLANMGVDEAIVVVQQADSLEALAILSDAETEGPTAPCRDRVLDAIRKRRSEIVDILLPKLDPAAEERAVSLSPGLPVDPEKLLKALSREDLARAQGYPPPPVDPLRGLPEGTRLGLVHLPDGSEDVFAELPGGEKRRIGASSDPALRPVAVQIRKAALQAEHEKSRRLPSPPIEVAHPSPLQALFADLAAALAPMKAAGIRVSITIDTDGGVS